MKTVFLAASLVVVLSSAALAHQDPEPVQPGDRVRITCPALSPQPVIGTLVRTNEQELVVERADGLVSISRGAVVALEKSLGRRPRWGTRIAGALYGTSFVLAGVAVCPAICVPDGAGGCLPCGGRSTWETARGYAAVVAGGAIGFGLGSLFKTEKWEKAGAPALTLEAAPTRGGARVSLRLRF